MKEMKEGGDEGNEGRKVETREMKEGRDEGNEGR
jgi:hypothetical protein